MASFLLRARLSAQDLGSVCHRPQLPARSKPGSNAVRHLTRSRLPYFAAVLPARLQARAFRATGNGRIAV